MVTENGSQLMAITPTPQNPINTYTLPGVSIISPTGVDDTVNINAGLANGGTVLLLPTDGLNNPYIVSSPILPTSQSRLWGSQWWSASNSDYYGAGAGASGGTVIYAASTFTGTAIINMSNPTGNQYYGVDLAGFTIEGFSIGGSGAHGILVDGAWSAGFIRGVCIHRPDQWCLRFQVDTTSGKEPDDWQITGCKMSASRNAGGIYADNVADSWFTDTESSDNQLDNWYLNWSTNTRLSGCKGENSNAGAGFHLTGQGYPNASLALTGCTTHDNFQDGFLFDNAGGGSYGNYQLANCYSINDNQAGTSPYSGYRSNGCRGKIMASNCFAYGAAYGAYEGNTSYGMCFTGSYLEGTTAATHDDATNTHALVNQSPVPF